MSDEFAPLRNADIDALRAEFDRIRSEYCADADDADDVDPDSGDELRRDVCELVPPTTYIEPDPP